MLQPNEKNTYVQNATFNREINKQLEPPELKW